MVYLWTFLLCFLCGCVLVCVCVCEERKNHKKEINRLHAAVVVNMPTADCLCQALLRNVMHKRTGRQRKRQRKREGRQDGRKYTTNGSFKQIGKHCHTHTYTSTVTVTHKSFTQKSIDWIANKRRQQQIQQQNPTKPDKMQYSAWGASASQHHSIAASTTHLHLRREHCTVGGIDVQVDGTVISAYRMHLLQQLRALYAHCIEYL